MLAGEGRTLPNPLMRPALPQRKRQELHNYRLIALVSVSANFSPIGQEVYDSAHDKWIVYCYVLFSEL